VEQRIQLDVGELEPRTDPARERGLARSGDPADQNPSQ
jgi:hypothetical protein